MKKLLISILVVLLMILTYMLVLKDISIFSWKNKSVDDVKSLNAKMEEQIDIAKQLNNQKYPDSIATLEKSIKTLETSKEKYESKIKHISENAEIGVVKVKEYKIERLWIAMELYAKEENVELKLDILETTSKNIYDLDVTVIGSYIGITDFIYDIEKDDTLGFKIMNFKMVPNTTLETTQQSNSNKTEQNNTTVENKTEEKTEEKIEEKSEENIEAMENTTKATATVNPQKLKATFKIEDVGIEFN